MGKNDNKFVIGLIICVIIFSIALVGCSEAVAVVSGEKITQKQVNTYLDFVKSQDTENVLENDEEQLEAIKANIMDSLIVITLLKQYASSNDIEVNQGKVEQKYQEVVESYTSEEDLEQELEGRGIEIEFFKNELRDQTLREEIYNRVTGDIEVSEQEIKDFYEQNKEIYFKVPEKVKVSHILVQYNESGQEATEADKKEALDKIEFIKSEIEEGKDFSEVAKEYSDDTLSAENGGDLGYITKDQMVKEFEDAAFQLEVGEVSSPVETIYGYHILKVTDKQEEYIEKYEDAKETAKQYLLNERKSEAWEDFVYGLLDEAEIEYNVEYESSLTRNEENGNPES
ncbi:MAG: peptidylprolyl isomerase [Candidatus Humimicrobiaceae bacterium]